MKHILFTLFTCLSFAFMLQAQDDWDLGVNYSAWLADPFGKVFKNTPVQADVAYKDAVGNTLYRESHSGASDLLGNYSFQVGKGTPVEGSLTPVIFKQVYSVSYIFTVEVDGQPTTISNEKQIGASPRANAAACALMSEDSKRLGGADWSDEEAPIGQLLCPPDDRSYHFTSLSNVPLRKDQRSFVTTPVTQLVRKKTTTEVNSNQEINFLSVGAGLGLPMWCGPDPDVIECMHGIKMPSIGNLNYGVELCMEDYDADHPTASLYTINKNADGFGMRSYGATGFYSSGSNGGASITEGPFNGYGIFGVVGGAPEINGFKYGVAASNGDFDYSYAAALFGVSFTTGAIMTMSDARLKTGVRSSHNALSRINQLRPTMYEYVDNTPYNLPKGIQHGFIAQDMETVFPELVKEIAMPGTLETDKIGKSDVTLYKAINYEGLVPILTAALQELDGKVIAQQSEIENLKEIVDQLSAQLAMSREK